MADTFAPPDSLTIERLPTPIGTALIVTDEAGVLRAFNWTDYESAMRAWIGRAYPRTTLTEGRAAGSVRQAFQAYFAGDARALETAPWQAAGTPFQRKVWRALCEIPAGATWSYRALAQRVGQPTAVRAVARANGANPVAVIVPCHRVIGSDGSLTGYGGGLPRKQWLLQMEGAAFQPARAPAAAF